MLPTPAEDFSASLPIRSRWQSLRDLALSALVVFSLALMVSLLKVPAAHAQPSQAAKGELRIGSQKSASLFVLQKAQGTLD